MANVCPDEAMSVNSQHGKESLLKNVHGLLLRVSPFAPRTPVLPPPGTSFYFVRQISCGCWFPSLHG
ncbi:hypothetical protein FJTKL_01505 [Diaporthe vaccinii]|uniref:Uncharacterized protein n=1 Tax=Diaporthe vaccinii TaxID=105482 RepID=A0ABR4E0P0_9PEZI